MDQTSSFVAPTHDVQADLALLLETGLCKVNATASLIVLPTPIDYNHLGMQTLDSILPPSALEMLGGPPTRFGPQHPNDPQSRFLYDNWHFIELHQSLQFESSQQLRSRL
eukprot:gnl/Spiro4/13990_TR7498_c0_g1_i1.p1 gnl/Spiro4/13990_TR7498_c0_g1~~gnl/Spiro4/13990_TR7498_c0_g1_i1.p1  ORF type:complete len:110 (+),score=15.65 gnl/Spiro4/13990_TR7498_c0_g1_i1:124-453(+)